HTFGYASKKAISNQVIKPVHIQLPRHQLMKKSFGMLIGKYIDRNAELSSQFFIEVLHDQDRDGFVVYTRNKVLLQCMGKWPMPNIMKQDRHFCAQFFLCSDFKAFAF